MNSRLCLKNVPISMTKDQILAIFFPDLEKVEMHFSKRFYNGNRNVLIQLNSRNEAILCSKFINRLEYQNVEAVYTEPNANKSLKTRVNERQCAFCGEFNSGFVCNDCSTLYFATFYCCKDHQERDWSRHKSECKPLPQLKRSDDLFVLTPNEDLIAEDILTESETLKKGKYFIKINDLNMEPNSKVVITSVANSRVLYIRPLCPDSDDLINTINNYAANAPVLLEKPSINEYVLAPFNNSYQRAKVIKDLFEINNSGFNIQVVLTDFGNELKLRWQDLKYLNYKTRGMPSYTQKVMLNDVPDEKFNQNIDNYLNKLCSNKVALEIVDIFGSQINDRKVILKHSQTGAVINEIIRNMLDNSGNEKLFYDVTKVPRFSTRSVVKIFVSDCSQLENEKLLSCMPYEKFSDYFLMLDELNKYCKRMPNEAYSPLLNEICLVKHNERWFRASCCINHSQSELIKVILIDLMINVTIINSDIRKIPQLFAQHFYTSLCFVEGVNGENFKEIKKKIEKDKFIDAKIRYDNETKCPVLNNLFY